MWFMEEPSQFSVGQTAQNLTCAIMEKPHTGLDDCLNMLLSCFRKRLSVQEGVAQGNDGDPLNPRLHLLGSHQSRRE